MQSVISQKITVSLVLSKEEAAWLNSQMQNPLHGQAPEQESTEDALMRSNFFHATKLPQ